jgi:hypothetical protein
MFDVQNRLESTTQEYDATKCLLKCEIETLKVDCQTVTEQMMHTTNLYNELCNEHEAKKAENELLRQQLIDKDSQCHQLLEQGTHLNERLEAMQLAHQGMKHTVFMFCFVLKSVKWNL